MRAHENEYTGIIGKDIKFEKRGNDDHETCSWCGSMSVAGAIKLLQTEGVHYSGSDWKYGWPHKLYIHEPKGFGKFYTSHLLDSSPEEIEAFNKLTIPLLGLDFKVDAKGLKYAAVMSGWQTWGTVGKVRNGDQVDRDFGPMVPDQFIKASVDVRAKATKA